MKSKFEDSETRVDHLLTVVLQEGEITRHQDDGEDTEPICKDRLGQQASRPTGVRGWFLYCIEADRS